MPLRPPDLQRSAGVGVTTRWAVLGWSLAGLLALVHAWMLQRYAVDFPSGDDFTQMLVVPLDVARQPQLAAKLGYLFSLSVEHQIVVIRSIALLQATFLGGIDFRVLTFAGNLACAATGLLVLWQAPKAWRGWLAPVFALLLFSPTNYHAQLWPTAAVQHYAMVAYALFALYCAQRAGRGWTLAAVLLALCAAGTAANGLMVFVAAAVQLALAGRRRGALGWLAGGALVALAYFAGYRMSVGTATPLVPMQHPVQFVVWALAMLGSMGRTIGRGYGVAIALGALIALAWAWLLAPYRRYPVRPLFVGWMLFLAATAAAITFGRAAYGLEAVVTSRYRVYSELAMLVTLLACAWRLHDQGRLAAQRALLMALPLFAVPWAWVSWGANIGTYIDYAYLRRNGVAHYAATGGHGMYAPFPPQAFGDSVLAQAVAARVFKPPSTTLPPAALAAIAHTNPVAAPRFADYATPFVFAGALSVRGQTLGAAPDVVLWLACEGQNYSGKLRKEHIFDPLTGDVRLGFWNTFTLAGVMPGRYRVGYAQQNTPAAAVAWTDDSIDIP